MIPAFNLSGVLPPFVGRDPAQPVALSPYPSTIMELVTRFATSAERIQILAGLLDYRTRLREIGIVEGFQWVDGSFCENVEQTESRPPGDIDIVTFASLSQETYPDLVSLIGDNPDVFDSQISKETHKCDAYLVNTAKRPDLLIADTTYWFGLFSHKRATFLWKGIISLPLVDLDDNARDFLELI